MDDKTKTTPGGQVMQENVEPQDQDMNPAGTGQGAGKLGMQFVDGKSGSVTKLDNVQTDHTDEHSGPAPQY